MTWPIDALLNAIGRFCVCVFVGYTSDMEDRYVDCIFATQTHLFHEPLSLINKHTLGACARDEMQSQ